MKAWETEPYLISPTVNRKVKWKWPIDQLLCRKRQWNCHGHLKPLNCFSKSTRQRVNSAASISKQWLQVSTAFLADIALGITLQMYLKGGLSYDPSTCTRITLLGGLPSFHVNRPKITSNRPRNHTGHKRNYRRIQVRNFHWKIISNFAFKFFFPIQTLLISLLFNNHLDALITWCWCLRYKGQHKYLWFIWWVVFILLYGKEIHKRTSFSKNNEVWFSSSFNNFGNIFFSR